jgi:hypothetical protein
MGKSAARKQSGVMNQMQDMASDQFDYFKGEQIKQQGVVDAQKEEYKNFEFTNDFADLTNPYANIQTEFDNVYAGAENVYAGAENTFAGAQNTFAGAENAFANMDNAYSGLENKYDGMENRFEDMTVDMRAADFQAQQGQQQRANIMQGLKGAAGSSGVAGLAQAMANQGQMQSQQIAAGIGQQERQNAMMSAQEGSRIDQMQRGAGMQLQQLEAGGTMANQQMAAQGAMQQQNMQMSGAMQAQNMQMQGAAAQQAMIMGGADTQQQLILQGQQTAVNQGISQGNIQAQGQGVIDMQIAQGNADVQAAQFGQQSTLLGLEYGALAGANEGLSSAMGNQMSALGMKADAYGSQSASGASTFGNIVSTAGSIKVAMLCVPKGVRIDIVDGTIAIEDINPGDIVIGYNGDPVRVLQKHEYLEDPTKERFYEVEFNNGSKVNVCDMHKIMCVAAKDITENVLSKKTYGGVEFSYDLLTEDLGYRINSTPVNSMIEELACAISNKIKNK